MYLIKQTENLLNYVILGLPKAIAGKVWSDILKANHLANSLKGLMPFLLAPTSLKS